MTKKKNIVPKHAVAKRAIAVEISEYAEAILMDDDCACVWPWEAISALADAARALVADEKRRTKAARRPAAAVGEA